MTTFGAQVVALLDQLEIEQAVIGGTSLGANVTLEVAVRRARARARDAAGDAGARQRAARLRDRVHAAARRADVRRAGHEGRAGGRAARAAAAAAARGGDHASTGSRRTPARAPPCCRACSSAASRRTARERRTFEAPALVIGHPRDPVHPFSDAGMLAAELPNGAAAERRLDPRAAHAARAPDGRDRRVRRRLLEAADGELGAQKSRAQTRGPRRRSRAAQRLSRAPLR